MTGTWGGSERHMEIQAERIRELEAEVERLRKERDVLAYALHWARATFALIARDDYARGCDQLLKRYGVRTLDELWRESVKAL